MTARATYPTRARVTAAVASAAAAGLDVGAIEVSPAGTIRIYDLRACKQPARDEFEQWESQGKL